MGYATEHNYKDGDKTTCSRCKKTTVITISDSFTISINAGVATGPAMICDECGVIVCDPCFRSKTLAGGQFKCESCGLPALTSF